MRVQIISKHRQVTALIIGAILLALSGAVQGEPLEAFTWRKLETEYTIIHYRSVKDLERFNSTIDFGSDKRNFKRIHSSGESGKILEITGNKVDAVYERTQEILDMRKAMEKVTIHIYPDAKALSAAYLGIYNKPCNIRAWYIFEYHTVYLNVQDLHEGMLAHELAHAIIDHFLLVRPPAATAEILARYVDSHLK